MSSSPWEHLVSLGIQFYDLKNKNLLAGNKVCKQTVKIPCIIEDYSKYERDELTCDEYGCNATFDSRADLDVHQKARHTHVCLTCHKIFPSYHLLDRHILETHDSFFKICSTKKPMYACLLEFCPDVFLTPLDRKEHCLLVHKFPADFRYDLQWRKLKPATSSPKPSGATTSRKKNKKKSPNAPKTSLEKMECMNSEDGQDNVMQNAANKQVRRKVPASISFGSGIPRGFHSARGRRGKPHWHQKNKTQDTRTHVDKISMEDMNQILEEMET